MVKKDYQSLEFIITAIEKQDVVTLSMSDGTTFNAQDYGWWSTNNFMGGSEE